MLFQNSIMKNFLRGSKVDGLNCKDLRSEKKDMWVELGRKALKELPRNRAELNKRSYLLSTAEI